MFNHCNKYVFNVNVKIWISKSTTVKEEYMQQHYAWIIKSWKKICNYHLPILFGFMSVCQWSLKAIKGKLLVPVYSFSSKCSYVLAINSLNGNCKRLHKWWLTKWILNKIHTLVFTSLHALTPLHLYNPLQTYNSPVYLDLDFQLVEIILNPSTIINSAFSCSRFPPKLSTVLPVSHP